jgi:hypothetical protein
LSEKSFKMKNEIAFALEEFVLKVNTLLLDKLLQLAEIFLVRERKGSSDQGIM